MADAGGSESDLFSVVRAELLAAGVKPSPTAEQEQHFLCSRDKLKLLSSAVSRLCSEGEGEGECPSGPARVVMELGAGAGSVARCLSPSPSLRLVLVELDCNLCSLLRSLLDAGAFAGWQGVEVIEGDALSALSSMPEVEDGAVVVVSSLPSSMTQAVLKQLTSRPWLRGAVMAVAAEDAENQCKDENGSHPSLSFATICALFQQDFEPPQKGLDAALVLVTPRSAR